LKKRLLHYRFRANHRVSLTVFVKLRLRSFVRALVDVGTPSLQESEPFCFVTGCGHSGTTLLASKLGLHPDVLLISRESGIFLPVHGLRLARVIVQEWLAFARQAERCVVLEKTPKHVHTIGRIRRLLPAAKVIVVVRNPLDTVASLYKRFEDLDFSIERWLMDNEAALRALQAEGTKLVRYEDLTREPEATLAAACAFLGLPCDAGILARSGSVYGSHPELRRNMAVRHEQVSQPIRDNSGKWREVLSPEQAERVRTRTAALAQRLGYPGESA
jgi:hypothetical protein